ncbi:MAG: YgjV family protein [Clostridia bacterium]|nr:YgjV family protein [Clostridia bacterium]
MLNLLSINNMFDGLKSFLNSNLGIWYIVLFNFFGVLAIIIKVSEYQFKKRTIRFIICTCASLCWLVYFILQGQTVSALANLVSLVQTLVFMQRENHEWAKSKIWLYVFLTLQIAICVVGFKVWHDIFPPLAGIFGAIAYFVIDEKTYRYFALLNVVFWLANSIAKMPMTVLALVCDATCTISGIIGLIRFFRRKKEQTQQENNQQKLDMASEN